MKLAVVTNILAPYRVSLFAELAKQVEDFSVFLMASGEENRQWKIGAVPFKTQVLPGVHWKPPGADISLHWNYGVLAALRRADPDVVMSGGFAPANIEAFLYCKLFRKAYVGWGEFTLRDNARSSVLRRVLRRWMTKGSAASIASSSEARDAFVHYGAAPNSVFTSLMPIEVDRFHDAAGDCRRAPDYHAERARYSRPVMLSVGRLTDAKGMRDLLQIYDEVVRRKPEASLLIVGDGPDRAAYECWVKAHRLPHVHFLGYIEQDRLPRYLTLADLFVFPTRSDTYGAVLAEAMAAELPVASSIFAAATEDLVEDGVNGVRIIPTLHGASAARILDLLELSEEERRAMGQAAYRAVRRTNVVESAAEIAGFLSRLRPVSPSPSPERSTLSSPGEAVR